MDSSHQKDIKNEMSFFTSLRRLGRELDQGIADIHGQLDARSLKSYDNKHLALKCLRDRKKDVESVKANARGLLKEVRHRGNEFEQSLQACADIIDIQLRQLTSIHAHLNQYGFVPQGDDREVPAEVLTNDDEGQDVPATPPEQNSQKFEIERKSKMTPCLEDYGLSSYTLNMLSRPLQRASAIVSTSWLPDSQISLQGAPPEQDTVPVIFQNQGLIVTPSIFSQPQVMEKGTDRKSEHVPFRLVWDKDVTCDKPGQPQTGLPKTLDASDSPVPPVLQTPGVKQIPRLGQAPDTPSQAGGAKEPDLTVSPDIPVLQTPGMKQIPPLGQAPDPPPQGDNKSRVARKLKLGEESKSTDSPVPPILRTPGMKQISTNSTVAAVHRYGSAPRRLELPPTPEMTFSLKDLKGMKVSFRHADLSSTFNERSAMAVDFDASDTTHTGTLSRQPPKSRNVSPPPRQGFGVKVLRAEVPEPKFSNWASCGLNAESFDLTARPELTMSYNSASATSLSCSAVTASDYRSGLGVEKHGVLPEPQMSSFRKDKFNTQALDLPTSHELTMSYNNTARTNAISNPTSHRPRIAAESHQAVTEPQLSNWTKDRFRTSAVDLPTSPELTMSYTSKVRTNAASHRSRLAVDSHEALPEPKLSSLSKHRFNSKAVDLPISPELTMSYSRMAVCHLGSNGDTCKPEAKSSDINPHYDESYLGSGGSNFQEESSTGSYSKGSQLSHVSDIPPSKENVVHPGPQELAKGKTNYNVSKQLRAQHPLTDTLNFDLPSTPNFLGSYHFMK